MVNEEKATYTTSPAGKKSTIQIPNPDDLRTKIKQPAPGPAKAIEEVPTTTSASFTKEDLDQQWQEYMAARKARGKDQEVMLLKEPYTLDGEKVTLKLSNDVLKITFDRMKADLQGFLRKALHNTRIVLTATVEEIAAEDMLYTNKEKFMHLAKKYPPLKMLQEKLGLDPDY